MNAQAFESLLEQRWRKEVKSRFVTSVDGKVDFISIADISVIAKHN